MGTRHLTIVVKDNGYKVAQYGQWDGYPGGQGLDILRFLQKSDISLFKKQLNNAKFISGDAADKLISKAYNEANSKYPTDFMKREQHINDSIPTIVRDTGSKILNIIYESTNVVKLCNSIEFATNSLFCEWAYLINIDDNTLEVYKGFNKEKLPENDRFKYLEKNMKDTYSYYPIKKIKTYKLDKLPSEDKFLKDLKEDDED